MSDLVLRPTGQPAVTPVTHLPIPSSTSQELMDDLRRLVDSLRRGWRLIMVSVTVCLAMAGAYLSRANRVYQATTRVLILQQGGRPLSVGNNDPVRLLEGADDQISTHAAVISSPLVVGRAIERVGLERLPSLAKAQSPLGATIEHLRVNRPDRTARILQIQYLAGSRDEAIRMVEAVTASYQEFLEDSYKNSGEIITLITRARDDLGKELGELEQKYLEFRQNNTVLSTDEAGRSFVSRRLDQWERAANDASVKAIRLRSQLELGKKLAEGGAGLKAIAHAMSQMGDDSPSLANYTAGDSQDSSSAYVKQLEQAREELSERYGPQYSKVHDLQERITRIQERTRESRGGLGHAETGDLLRAVEESLKSIESMRAVLQTRFEQDRDQAKKVESDLMVESNLRSNLERHRTLFNTVVEQMKQAQFVGDFSNVRSQVIEPANALHSPVSPRVKLTLALALVAGCMLGFGAAVVADRTDPRIRSIDEMRELLGLSVIGQIPQVREGQAMLMGEMGLASHAMPRSFWAESFRTIRTNLDFLRRDRAVQVVLITSPHSDDGKTIMASNLAICVAQAGRKVLLVDGDMRKPDLHRTYSLTRDRGLSQVLRGRRPFHRAVQLTSVNGLDLISSGPDASDPAELLTSDRFVEFICDARRLYEFVIIDSPPILAVADPMIIAATVDGVMLVVKPSSLRHHETSTILELLHASGSPVIGVLANGVGRERKDYTYGPGPARGAGVPPEGFEGAAPVVSGDLAETLPDRSTGGPPDSSDPERGRT